MNEYGEESLGSSAAQTFAEGGWAMYPLTALGCLLPLLALGFLVVGLVSKTNRALPLGVGLLLASLLPPALAVGATALERAKIAELLDEVSEGDRETIRMGSEGELLALKVTGFGAALCPGFFSFVLLGVGLARLPRFKRS